jgi:hypothetical protein
VKKATNRRLKKGQLLEIVEHAVERQLHAGETARVLFDQKIPEIITGTLRQVDTAVFVASGGHEYLRSVEVQDRGSRAGSQTIDWVAEKARSIGAHRVTLATRAGFTKGALERIEKQYPSLIDPVELRPGKPEEWPPNIQIRNVAFKIGGEVIRSDLHRLRYIDARSGKLVYQVLYWVAPIPSGDIVGCALVDPAASETDHGLRDFFFLTHAAYVPGDRIRVTLSYETPDGEENTWSQARPLETQEALTANFARR